MHINGFAFDLKKKKLLFITNSDISGYPSRNYFLLHHNIRKCVRYLYVNRIYFHKLDIE